LLRKFAFILRAACPQTPCKDGIHPHLYRCGPLPYFDRVDTSRGEAYDVAYSHSCYCSSGEPHTPLPEAPPRARGAGDLGPAKAELPALRGARFSDENHPRPCSLTSCPSSLRLSPMLEEHRNAFLERSPVSPSRTAGEVPKIPQNDTDHDRGEVAKEQRSPQREWPSSRRAMQMEATRVYASIVLRS